VLSALFASVLLILGQFTPAAYSLQARNTIEGRVTGNDTNRGIENIRVFLLNDGYSQVGSAYTDPSGRYQFKNVSSGNYYVQVETSGTDYERQTQRVEINPISLRGGGGAEFFHIDFVLRPRKTTAQRTSGSSTATAKGVTFYQDVPDAARAEYQRGVKALQKDNFGEAVNALKKAVEIFPDYYDAMEALGSSYVRHKDYQAALPLLKHAVEINKNGWAGFYALGVTLVELDQRNDGLKALRRAVELNPDSPNASMRLGYELANEEQHHTQVNERAQAQAEATEAIRLLKNAARLAGKSEPRVYVILAHLYSKYQQYAEAADALEAYLRADPQSDQRDQIKEKIEQLKRKATHPQTK
jgi:cytochrome c-type biogenesis protein CcmH/NrfG